MYSETFNNLMENLVGYRNDNWTNIKVYDIEEILYEEIVCLQKTSIIDFLNIHLNANIDINFEIEDDEILTEEDKEEAYLLSFQENAPDIFHSAMEFINKTYNDKFNNKPLYGLWLTSLEGVQENYHSYNSIIKGYNILSNWMPICDIDKEGILFIMSNHPSQSEI